MKAEISRYTILLPGIIFWMLPAYMEARTEPELATAGNVQGYLGSDEVILEYCIVDSVVRINAIENKSSYFVTQTLDRLFWRSLVSFREKLKSADPVDFSVPGEILYLYLISPVETSLAGKHRLIIIPDDRLSGVPFEAFIRNKWLHKCKNTGNLHYLIQDFEIVYQCSIDSWYEKYLSAGKEPAKQQADSRFAFMGFSPGFKGVHGLAALPGAKSEIVEIGSLFRRQGLSSWLVFEEDSEKNYFTATAWMGRIIHLATHFIPDKPGSKAGGILFTENNTGTGNGRTAAGLLTLAEMEALHLEADLIVLNGCGTGVKQDTRANSLPQLLIMAGARNILSTLWNVTDNLAGRFMVDFYRSWLSGKTYSEALRDVKLQWISHPGTTFPAIWAPYVLMGQ